MTGGFMQDGKFHPIAPYTPRRLTETEINLLAHNKGGSVRMISKVPNKLDEGDLSQFKMKTPMRTEYKRFIPLGGVLTEHNERNFDSRLTHAMNEKRIEHNLEMKRKSEPVTMKDVEKFFDDKEVSKILGIGHKENDYNSFHNADPFLITSILDIPNLLQSNDHQNGSPNAKKMIELAEMNHGKLLGYWIPKSSGRSDSRVSLNGFVANISDEKALELKNKLHPDEFKKQDNGWRFYWS